MVERTCKRCGRTFHIARNRFRSAKYCSTKCYSMGVVEKKCKNCGKKYNIKKYISNRGLGVFCSRKCHYEYGHTTKKCKNCKKCFVVQKYRIRNGKVMFCSLKCKSKWFITRVFIKRTCLVCKKIFKARKIKNTINFKKSKLSGRFCSKKCALIYKHKKGSKKIKCKRCGKEITKTNSQIRIGHKHCSKKCAYESGNKYPIEIRKLCRKENGVVWGYFGSGEISKLAKKTWAIRTALRKGVLNKTLLNQIQKGATYEAYL